ncbi:MAG: alpha-L-arabinofuranosidase C-terminal domain-containing protein, partial [Armatimonadota bacterium]
VVQAVAVHDGEAITVFALNRDPNGAPAELDATLRGFGEFRTVRHTVLRNDDLKAVNTAEAPETVIPVEWATPEFRDGFLRAILPPYSWNVLRLVP